MAYKVNAEIWRCKPESAERSNMAILNYSTTVDAFKTVSEIEYMGNAPGVGRRIVH